MKFSFNYTEIKKSLEKSDAAIWGSKGNRWVSQLQYIDLSPSPFTGYACVIVSINYRLTHRTTDATGPHVSNTNVSLHKSITRNILRNIKGKRGKGGKGEVGGGSDWKSIWWKTILFWFCTRTRTTNQLMAMADLEHPPAPTCCMWHFALCGGASALALPLPLATRCSWAVRA